MTEEEKLKLFVVEFFYWWYNQPGNNTSEGYDLWLETKTGKELLSKLVNQPKKGDL